MTWSSNAYRDVGYAWLSYLTPHQRSFSCLHQSMLLVQRLCLQPQALEHIRQCLQFIMKSLIAVDEL